MGKLAIMPLKDYQNLCNNIRELTGTTGPIKSGDMVTKTDEAVDSGAVFDTSDATAAAGEIFEGETAYVNGNKITGTFTIDSELTTQNNLISELTAILGNKAANTGTDTSDATATANDILASKTAYVDGEKITGTIPTKTSSDLSASGAVVTVPAGYYASNTTKSVATTTQATPSVNINSSGLITTSVTQTEGYISAGTKNGTKQLTTQGAKTITPSTSSQTAVASGVYTTGAITVAAIPSNYVKPSATKAATTYTPTTSNQTIAAGTYCSGAQTIQGDANLKAENIASGVSIFGVTGTYVGSGGGSGGSIETCSVLFNSEAPTVDSATVYYVNENMEVSTQNFDIRSGTTITVAKNTILTVTPWINSAQTSGECTKIMANGFGGSYVINGESTITYG
jgi:hypothetical protein